MKKELDLNNLTIVDESEVPAQPKRYTPYRALLKRIRKGKALVLTSEQIRIDTARSGINRIKKRGEFKQIVMRQITEPDGTKKLFIINPSEKETQT
jgi:hypothetical protein